MDDDTTPVKRRLRRGRYYPIMAASSGGYVQGRIAYIDGLRAVAVLSVVVFHAAHWDPHLHSPLARHLTIEGAHGVDLFFVLSGFCLSYPFLRRLHDTGSARFDTVAYFARRMTRILPPYYLAMLAIGIGLVALQAGGWQMPEDFSLSRIDGWQLFKQIVFADRKPQFLNPSFWTLAVEWRWYVVFPLVLILWTRSPRAFVFVAASCALAGMATRAGGFDLALLPAFMSGIGAAWLEIRSVMWGRTALLGAILAVCIGLAVEPYYDPDSLIQQQVAWQIAAFCLVVASGCLSPLRRVLSWRPLEGIGLASYSIYLVHEPVIAALETNTALSPALAGIVAVIAGCVFWVAVERWFLTDPLKGWLTGRLAAPLQRVGLLLGIPVQVVVQKTRTTHRNEVEGSPHLEGLPLPPEPEALETR